MRFGWVSLLPRWTVVIPRLGELARSAVKAKLSRYASVEPISSAHLGFASQRARGNPRDAKEIAVNSGMDTKRHAGVGAQDQRGRLDIAEITVTPRQRECIVLVARGKSDRQISDILGISPETVHRHVEAAKKRFAVATRVELVVLALLNSQITFADAVM
jgi:DNA-binding CsgD family transcriptional regulator